MGCEHLFCLVPQKLGPSPAEAHLRTKVFGNYKNSKVDRQIGDRRGRNFVEGKTLDGPSHEIPNATALLQLETKRFEEVLVGAVAGRRDHQFSVSTKRAATNTVFPPCKLRDFKNTNAYKQFIVDFGEKKARDREVEGDFFGVPKPLLVQCDDDTPVYAAFAALFQGDHLGVEFACCAHAKMLEDAGCHPAENRLCASQAIARNKPVTGLVIDDYFALSAEDIAFAREATPMQATACPRAP